MPKSRRLGAKSLLMVIFGIKGFRLLRALQESSVQAKRQRLAIMTLKSTQWHLRTGAASNKPPKIYRNVGDSLSESS